MLPLIASNYNGNTFLYTMQVNTMGISRTSIKSSMTASLALVMAGCGTMDQLTSVGDKVSGLLGQSKNAAQYDCKGGKSFYVRMLEKDNAAWVTLPDREVRFDKAGDKSGEMYRNGTAVLEITGNQASIKDGTDTSFADCKIHEEPVEKKT